MTKNANSLILVLSLSFMLTCQAPAQTFKILHTFTGTDGSGPNSTLVLSGNTLYGTTYYPVTSGWGTVFAINTDGTGFTTVHGFTRGTPVSPYNTINTDGASPRGGLVLSGNRLYGTAFYGGMTNGTVFAINTDGTAFTTLHTFSPTSSDSFTNIDGANPTADLLLLGNTLYGTTQGDFDSGSANSTLFAINTDGTGFRVLHTFEAHPTARDSGLVLSGSTLYGATIYGGAFGYGSVFAINTDGTGFRVLHNFAAGSSDASHPVGRLLLSGNTLYGAAEDGGSSDQGTVFAINTDGTGFKLLHSFAGGSDGFWPSSGLVLLGNTLYGMCLFGGSSPDSANGTVYSLNVDGTGFTTLYTFSPYTYYEPFLGFLIATNADGAHPQGGLVLSGNVLYGTALEGGSFNLGTVFSISLLPRLTASSSGTNLVLSWPTNAIGFALQSTTNPASPTWTAVSPAPVVVNGQYTVTNPISGTQQFFRLSK